MCGALGVMPNSIVPAVSASRAPLNFYNLDFLTAAATAGLKTRVLVFTAVLLIYISTEVSKNL